MRMLSERFALPILEERIIHGYRHILLGEMRFRQVQNFKKVKNKLDFFKPNLMRDVLKALKRRCKHPH